MITDDGSENEHIQKIFEIINKYQDLEIYYIFQQDRGFNISKARNNAIQMSRGDLIITLDGDIIVKQDFIQKHIKMHLNNKNILAYSDREFKDFTELSFSNIHVRSKNKKNIKLEEDEINVKNNSLYGWQKAGGFNVSFIKKPFTLYNEDFIGWGLEDVEFAYKLEKVYNYNIISLDTKVIHINKKTETVYNPYITKDKEQFKQFLLNALTIINTYKSKSNDFIRNLYIPNLNVEKCFLSEATLSCFDNFIDNNYKNITSKDLYKLATKEINGIIKYL